jgi:hypothetical protein
VKYGLFWMALVIIQADNRVLKDKIYDEISVSCSVIEFTSLDLLLGVILPLRSNGWLMIKSRF